MRRKNLLLFSSWRSNAKSPPEPSLPDPQPLHTSRSLPRIVMTSPQVTDGEVGSRAVSLASMSMPPPSSLRDRFARWVLRWRSPSPNDKSTTRRPKQSTGSASLQPSPDNSRLSLSSLRSKENVNNNTPSRSNPPAIYETSAASFEQPGSTGDSDGCSLGVESLPGPAAPAAGTRSHGDQKKTIMNAIKLLLQTSSTALKLAPIPNLDQIPNTLLAWINTYEVCTAS
ncbi:uncharacterized protein EI90DRAFT_1022248 [Cantharellus anzutake]|uniref:uncharacterized protein n=1 Tax=Cantharellus anzutake TaxID=1750568 RepID=UPI001903A98A|nr:uncharacterized protein EI90DRAFT_1022248 [Cantharellus anzutake]KAF8331441.1 hypothetical protein EI90DRAFT_1022248 [Cantharellus anzutake]